MLTAVLRLNRLRSWRLPNLPVKPKSIHYWLAAPATPHLLPTNLFSNGRTPAYTLLHNLHHRLMMSLLQETNHESR